MSKLVRIGGKIGQRPSAREMRQLIVEGVPHISVVDDVYRECCDVIDLRIRHRTNELNQIYRNNPRERSRGAYIEYYVPETLLGKPRYDCEAVVKRLYVEYIRRGYQVLWENNKPTRLCIAWR